MKFLFFIPILFSFVLFSQDNSKSVFTLKPSLGINGCQIHGDNYNGYNKLGVFAGIAVNAKFTNKASLDIGFYFSQKGAKHNPNPTKGDYAYYRVNLDYIDIPVLFRFKVNPTYFITLGPSIAYLVNYNENINYVDFTGAYK
ncbi:MAG: outer membrane beta-barrel protein, partial [Bacteroidota bacterium]